MAAKRASSSSKKRGQMEPTPEDVATRADGRPPEEEASENPEEQAEAILEDSEDRLEEGAQRSAEGGP
jgi:hypothetical protein